MIAGQIVASQLPAMSHAPIPKTSQTPGDKLNESHGPLMTTEDVSMAEALGLTEEDWHLLSRTSRTGNHRKRSCESLVSGTEELPTPEAKLLEKEQILTDKTVHLPAEVRRITIPTEHMHQE
jgi:hypothetical protein